MKEKINKTIITKKGSTIVIPNKIIRSEYPKKEEEPDIYTCRITNLAEASQTISMSIYVGGSAPNQNINCLDLYNNINRRLFKSKNKYYYDSIIVLCKYQEIPSNFYYAYSIAKSSYESMGTASWFRPTELIFLSYNKFYLQSLISDLNPIIKYETNFDLD